MHSDLSPHLHTAECNKIIKEFKDCNQEYKFRRFMGKCTLFETAVTKCLRAERIARAAANRSKAFEHQKLIREKIAKDPDFKFEA